MNSIPKSVPPKNIENRDTTLAKGDGPFSLADYIQLACMGNHNARMLLTVGDRRVGEVQVYRGELWTAIDARGAGLDSLRRLMFAKSLHIEARPLLEKKLKRRSIELHHQQALMDAARLQDEAIREREKRRHLSGVQTAVDLDGDGMPFEELPDKSMITERASFDPSPSEAARRPPFMPPPPPGRPRGESVRRPLAPSEIPRRVQRRAPPPPPPVIVREDRDFDELFEEAVEALLDKDYSRAHDLLMRADAIRDDPRVKAKLERLHDIGVGVDS